MDANRMKVREGAENCRRGSRRVCDIVSTNEGCGWPWSNCRSWRIATRSPDRLRARFVGNARTDRVVSLPTGEREQLLPLTSLRFVAAAMIVLTHSRPNYELSRNWGDPLILTMAVDFFFVLSGFILAHAYPRLDAAGTRRFLVARAARLWPLHIATFVLFLPIVYLHAPSMPSSTPVAMPANLALVHAWVPFPDSYFSFNPVSWTISTELGLYLLFPLLVRNWRSTWLPKLVLSIVLFAAMAYLARWFELPPFRFGQRGASFNGLARVNPLANVYPFVLGMAACSVWRYLEPRLRVGALVGTALEVAAVILAAWSMSSPETLSYGGIPALPPWSVAFPFLIVVMGLRRGLVSRLLSMRGMVLLGEISYAVYLVHYGIMLGFAYVRPSAPRIPDSAVYGLFWLVVLAASWALWRWVESPARSFVRAWWRDHEPALSPGQWRAVGVALAAAAALILALQIATLR
jgi:peptidoglycan/LPS O-acetylase OafA/YrhL